MAGVIPPPDHQLYLLPLLQPKQSAKPPLHRLPNGNPAPSRVAFTTKDSSGQSVDWISSTHVFPAAFPRTHYASTAPPSTTLPVEVAGKATLDKAAEREARKTDFEAWDDMAAVYSTESFYPPLSQSEADQLAENLADSRQPQLWSSVQRIVPSTKVKGGITLVLAHANGFHKEIYEPMVQSFVQHLEQKGRGKVQISEVWSLDTFCSGDAACLNRGSLGQAVSWFDHPRDILQFVNHYMPNEGEDPAVLLEAHTHGETRRGRRMVGVGHSFSGAGMVMLNSLYDSLFEGLFLIDPVGGPLHLFPNQLIPAQVSLARGAIARKDVFASRSAAADYLKSRPFFQTWDPRVLDLHVRFGFRPVEGHESEGNPPVTLSMSRWSEALAFSTSFLGSFHATQVKRSRFAGWAHLIYTSEGTRTIVGTEGSKGLQENFQKHFSTTLRATTDLMEGGHLIAQEQPDALGARMAQHILSVQTGHRSRL